MKKYWLYGLILGVAAAVTPVVAEIQVRLIPYSDGKTELEGLLAFDPAQTGPRPGVLLIHEWWGRNDYIERRAKEYAALGYTTFALDMYGKGIGAKTPDEATKLSSPFYQDRALFRRRALAGLAAFTGLANVDPEKIVALGYCFGGSAALELARSGANLKGTIVFHGGLSSPTPADAANIKGKLLVLLGANDPFVSIEERTEFKRILMQNRVTFDYVEYPGAQHAFTNPSVDSKNIQGAAYNKMADEDSFERSKKFLAEILSSANNS